MRLASDAGPVGGFRPLPGPGALDRRPLPNIWSANCCFCFLLRSMVLLVRSPTLVDRVVQVPALMIALNSTASLRPAMFV
jgi:hypothetical protein